MLGRHICGPSGINIFVHSEFLQISYYHNDIEVPYCPYCGEHVSQILEHLDFKYNSDSEKSDDSDSEKSE